MKYNYYDILSIDEIIDGKVIDYDMREKYKEEMQCIFIQLNELLNYYFPYNGKMPPYQEEISSNIITCWHNSEYLLKIDFENGYSNNGFKIYSYILGNNNLYKDTYSISFEKKQKKRGEIEIQTKNAFLEKCIYKDIKEYKKIKDAIEFVKNEKYLIPDNYEKIELDEYDEDCIDFVHYNDYEQEDFSNNYGYKINFNQLFYLHNINKEEINKRDYKIYEKTLKELKDKNSMN